MEQTVNLFTKGLQMDTNPMIQGSDTLTDALNATLVTMNGNEVILQNDMGNRRVDNAFLPPGYEPVGMKEYGGVIYVASYNPVTHRSQIGSFPSPERKISYTDNSNSNGKVYNFNFPSDETNYLEELCLKSDVLLNPIDNDLILHAGDKFVIYGDLSSVSNKITNYNNTISNKIKSPKNKLYTLSLGILNSQNEFVDITKDLVRWDSNNKIITEFENDSDLFKFNCGYFIASNYTPTSYENTINDNKLILERQAIPANTYSYKLCGPLYLKMLLNRPVKFNYNIYGYKEINENNIKSTITFDCFITYNCPDGIGENIGSLTNDIYEYSGIDSKLANYLQFCDIKSSKDFVCINYNPKDESLEKNKPTVTTISAYYDKLSNLYTINLRYELEYSYAVANSNSNKLFDYKLLVKSGITKETQVEGLTQINYDTIYLLDLSTKGEIDTSLLGSGTVKLTGWRFYNNFEKLNTILSYTFEAYPKYGLHFTNLRFIFKIYDPNTSPSSGLLWINVYNNTDTVELENLDLNNGRNTISFNWEEKGFLRRKLYKVYIKYDIISDSGEIILTDNSIEYNPYFITTELLNNRYSPSSDEFESYYLTNLDSNGKIIFNVPIGLNINLRNKSEYGEPEYEGSLISNDDDIYYNCKYIDNISIFDNTIYKIINEELYPDFILLRENIYPEIDNCKIIKVGSTLTDNNENAAFNEYVKLLLTKNGTKADALNSENFINFDISNSLKFIGGKIEHYDKFRSKGVLIDQISNAFCPVSNVSSIIFNSNNTLTIGCGLSVDYDAHDGGGDDHYLNLLSGVNPTNTSSGCRHNGLDTILLDSLHGDSLRTFKASNYENKINNEFNKLTQYNQVITYMYGDDKECYTTSTNILDHYRIATAQGLSTDKGCISNLKARVWMRTDSQGWALFKDLFPGNITTSTFSNESFEITSNGSITLVDDNTIIKGDIKTIVSKVTNLSVVTGHNYEIDIIFNNNLGYILNSVSNIKFECWINGWKNGKVLWHKGEITNNTLKIITDHSISANNGSPRLIRITIPKRGVIFKKLDHIISNLSLGELILDNIVPDPDYNYVVINNESNGVFKFSQEKKETINVNSIDGFVKSYFLRNYVYCAYDLYTFDDLSPIKLYRHNLLNSVYNEKYNIPITIGIKYKLGSNQVISPVVYPDDNYHANIVYDENNILNPGNSGFSVGSTNYLKKDEYTIDSKIIFKQNYTYQDKSTDSAIEIILSSKNDFLDEIQKYNDVSGVDISTGRYVDINNKKLDPNFIYSYNTDTGELQKEQYCYLTVDKLNKINNVNTLLYKGNNKGQPPTYRYNAIGWADGKRDHSSTILDFSGINLITTI